MRVVLSVPFGLDATVRFKQTHTQEYCHIAKVFNPNIQAHVWARWDICLPLICLNILQTHMPDKNGANSPLLDGGYGKFQSELSLSVKSVACKVP